MASVSDQRPTGRRSPRAIERYTRSIAPTIQGAGRVERLRHLTRSADPDHTPRRLNGKAKMIPTTTPTGPTVYLIHFNQRYHHSQHYIGFSTNLDKRITDHLCGMGARLLEVITAGGIEWKLARTWPGNRELERKLKRRKDAPHICPICSGKKANGRANYE